MNPEPLTIPSNGSELSAELLRPPEAKAILVLAHGAGAGFRHGSLTAISQALAAQQIASLRFNFPFMEAGRRRVDGREVAMAAVRDAAGVAARKDPDLPLYVGGHSFGGRMASHAVAEGQLMPRGLLCLSFPLHPPSRPGIERAGHLSRIRVPMLFVSGTRDALAEPELLSNVVAGLGPTARMHWLDDADHGYRVRKRRRSDPRPVFEEIAEAVAAFVATTHLIANASH